MIRVIGFIEVSPSIVAERDFAGTGQLLTPRFQTKHDRLRDAIPILIPNLFPSTKAVYILHFFVKLILLESTLRCSLIVKCAL